MAKHLSFNILEDEYVEVSALEVKDFISVKYMDARKALYVAHAVLSSLEFSSELSGDSLRVHHYVETINDEDLITEMRDEIVLRLNEGLSLEAFEHACITSTVVGVFMKHYEVNG